ncbi:MAG: NAD(P)-dependent oxidoreductase [Pyrinomonadaceae bacterium]
MPNAPSFDKVMVTGGGGFIGQHLVRALVQTGCRPVVVTRRSAPCDALRRLEDGFRHEQLNLLEDESVRDFLRVERPTVIFHLAGTRRSDDGQNSSVACAEMNVSATVRLLDEATRAGVERVVIMGSADEYGDQQGALHEGLPLLPASAYAISKAAATRFAQAMHANDGCPVVVLRPFSVYGPWQPEHMFVAEAVACAVEGLPFRMTHGRQRRDLVYVDDVVRALLACARAPGIEGEVINIGSGRALPLRDVAALIWQLSESRAPLLMGARPAPAAETHDTWADITLARRLLRWEPQVEVESGLRATIQWARERSSSHEASHVGQESAGGAAYQ